jgi:hypothetical protein
LPLFIPQIALPVKLLRSMWVKKAGKMWAKPSIDRVICPIVRTTFPPERVELRFSEPVEAEFDPVVVRAADGARVDAHDARVDPEDARIVLADLESVPRGTYTA